MYIWICNNIFLNNMLYTRKQASNMVDKSMFAKWPGLAGQKDKFDKCTHFIIAPLKLSLKWNHIEPQRKLSLVRRDDEVGQLDSLYMPFPLKKEHISLGTMCVGGGGGG